MKLRLFCLIGFLPLLMLSFSCTSDPNGTNVPICAFGLRDVSQSPLVARHSNWVYSFRVKLLGQKAAIESIGEAKLEGLKKFLEGDIRWVMLSYQQENPANREHLIRVINNNLGMDLVTDVLFSEQSFAEYPLSAGKRSPGQVEPLSQRDEGNG